MVSYSIYPPDEGIVLMEHAQLRRSGHLGHALVRYAPGKILAFYSNCAGKRNHGHSGFGWVEYRRSVDDGKTWGDPVVLRYAVDTFLDGECFIACEKAVSPAENVIVLSCLRCQCEPAWEPFLEPVVLRSFDGGLTWSEPTLLSPYKGRVYDMIEKNGTIYALHFCNPADKLFTGNAPDHLYRLYISRDKGETWQETSVLPFNTAGRGYGAMEFLPNGCLIAYVYNINDEYNADYLISPDGGRTWSTRGTAYFDKRIRNPQLIECCGKYFMHGRSGCVDSDMPSDLVLYASDDAIHWDDGRYIRLTPEDGWGACGYYSNSIRVEDRVLMQYSFPYFEGRTNVCQTWIEDIR